MSYLKNRKHKHVKDIFNEKYSKKQKCCHLLVLRRQQKKRMNQAMLPRSKKNGWFIKLYKCMNFIRGKNWNVNYTYCYYAQLKITKIDHGGIKICVEFLVTFGNHLLREQKYRIKQCLQTLQVCWLYWRLVSWIQAVGSRWWWHDNICLGVQMDRCMRKMTKL